MRRDALTRASPKPSPRFLQSRTIPTESRESHQCGRYDLKADCDFCQVFKLYHTLQSFMILMTIRDEGKSERGPGLCGLHCLVQDTHRVFLSPISRAWLHKGYIVEMEGVASRPGSIHYWSTSGDRYRAHRRNYLLCSCLSKRSVPTATIWNSPSWQMRAISALLPSWGLTGAQFFGEFVVSQFVF